MPSRRQNSSNNVSVNGGGSATLTSHRSKESTSYSHAPPSTAHGHGANGSGGSNHQNQNIQALVQRLWAKLPVNGGSELTEVEGDAVVQSAVECLVEMSATSLDVTALALTDVLDKMKQPKVQEPRTTEFLQSQLLMLKVLAVCMAARYHVQPSSKPKDELWSLPEQHQAVHAQMPADPPALDDNCARYMLVVMVAFLRQTAPPEGRLMSSANLSFEATFHDFESIEVEDAPVPPTDNFEDDNAAAPSINPALAQLNTRFERTHKTLARSHFSLNALILKFAGRIVYHLSASNWPVVLEKIQKKIRALAGSTDESPDIIDLYLMKHSALDRARLMQILHEMSSLLVNMALESRIALAVPLRTAIWNWIDLHPDEYDAIIRPHRRSTGLEGAPERVFDLLWDAAQPGESLAAARAIWPTLAVLAAISPERARGGGGDYLLDPSPTSRSGRTSTSKFLHALRHAAHAPGTKTQDVAIVCLLDLCRAAARASPSPSSEGEEQLPLRQLAADICHDVRAVLLTYEPGTNVLNGSGRPFWDASGEIDVAMFADALVATHRFAPRSEARMLFETCLEAQRADAVKLVAVKALVTLAVEARTGRAKGQPALDECVQLAAPRLRAIFKYGGVRRTEVDSAGALRRAAPRPRAKKFTAEVVGERELLIIAVLHAWRSHVGFILCGLDEDETHEWVPACMAVWEQQADTSVQHSIAMAFNTVSVNVHALRPSDPFYPSGAYWKVYASPRALWTVANALLNTRSDADRQRLWAEVGHAYALAYVEKGRPNDHILHQLQADPQRVPAFALLEIAAAVTLTSADAHVSRLAAHTLRLIAIAERQPGAPVNTSISEMDRGRRYPVYEQIGDPRHLWTGRLAWQKHIRKHFATLALPQPYCIAGWNECYFRWCALTELVIRAPADGLEPGDALAGELPGLNGYTNGLPPPSTANSNGSSKPDVHAEEQRQNWQHLTLFLAATGGACVDTDGGHDPGSLTSLVPSVLLPDMMRALRDPRELVGAFVRYLIDLLLVESEVARATALNALGAELHFRLHPRLLRALDDVVHGVVNDASSSSSSTGRLEWTEQHALFLNQILGVLDLFSKRMEFSPAPGSSSGELLSVDLTPTLFSLAGFINRFPLSGDVLRMRARLCLLADSLCTLPGPMRGAGGEGALRQRMLDVLLEWIRAPEGEKSEDEQRALNLAALRASVHFLDRLTLRGAGDVGGGQGHGQGGPGGGGGEGRGAEEAGHVAGRLFVRYSSAILRSLDFVKQPLDDNASESSVFSATKRTNGYHHALSGPGPSSNSLRDRDRAQERDKDADALEVRELVVRALARLVGANTEAGVKHALAHAYDSDPGRRLIFTKVFSRVMGQGAKLDAPEPLRAAERKGGLADMIKGPDITIALAICETCPSSEVDIIIPVLLNIFDTRQGLMTLMKALIDREMANTENEAELFRGNSTCTRMLSAFAKIHGYTYLRSLIVPLVKTMESLPSGQSYLLDPALVPADQREQNQRNVEVVATSFLNIITASVPAIPSMFREVCAHIGKAIMRYWPEAKFAALGAFIFLRFISPAVVSPAVVDVELPKENAETIRKGLMIVAKIIQNLANNIFFGKEAHMASLNDFLHANIIHVTKYLSELSKYTPAPGEEEEEWTGAPHDDTDTIVLHRFFDKHADKVGKELLSVHKAPAEGGESAALAGKRAWDSICTALVDLGQPIDVPRHSPLASGQHADFRDLMARYSRRNTASVRDLFVETYTPKGEVAVFVLFLCKFDIETLDIDLLLYHIFSKLTSAEYEGRQFSCIYDWTGFGQGSQLPMQWIKYCIEMVPSDVRARYDTSYHLNINAAAHSYLRRVHNVTAGTNLARSIRACSSIEELLKMVPATCAAPLVYARSLEQEPAEHFSGILMRQHHAVRVPVALEVGTSHLRVLADKALPVGPALACKPVEIIPFAEISDVYNVSSAQHDPGEFIIRKTRQAATLYFSTPARDQIVKSIRAAKGRMRSTSLPGTERFSRLSNVSAALLHISLLNLGADSSELRGASYELLASVISSFDLDTNPMLSTSGLFPLGGSTATAITPMLSEKIAGGVPHLTLDFVSEVCSTVDKSEPATRMHCMAYMAPWLRNLSLFVDPTNACYDASGAKLRDCVRLLIDLTLADPVQIMITQKTVWAEIGRLDSVVVNIILDELMRAAIDGGVASQRCETICLVMIPLTSINVRGQILSKIRKALGKTSVKPTRDLADNTHWNEIASLTRLALIAHQHGKQTVLPQFYLPELLHLVTLIAGTGETLVRTTVWQLVLDTLQALWQVRSADAIAGPEIQILHDEASTDDTLRYFGLRRATYTGDLIPYIPANEKEALDNQEGLVSYLMRVMETAAQTKGLLNVWRARWMSLVTATAFQVSPAVQARAFIVLGALATSDVDDDFFYQMLVALKTALSQFNDADTLAVVSMLRCIRNVVPALLANSRYLPQVFWLAVALLQSSHISLYAEAANLLQVSVEQIYAQGLLGEQSMSVALLEQRAPIEDIAGQLDNLLGLNFDTNFSFSLAAIVFKGMRLTQLRPIAVNVLRSLLRIGSLTHANHETITNGGPGKALSPEVLGYFLALLPAGLLASDFQGLIEDAGLEEAWPQVESLRGGDSKRAPRVQLELLGLSNNNDALLTISFIRTMIISGTESDQESEFLWCLLADVAAEYQDVLALTYDGLQDRIKDIFANSNSPAVMAAASKIYHISPPQQSTKSLYGMSQSSLGTVDEVNSVAGVGRNHLHALEELHMNGLAAPVNFIPASKPHAATKVINWISELVLRIIE